MTPIELGQRLYKAYKIGVFFEEKSSGCWETYNQIFDKDGYVRISLNNKSYRLHRLVINITSITVEGIDNLHSLHSCDNKKCINPYHLRWGTHQDNMDDMVKRKRSSSGSNHSKSRFSEEQIRELRNSNKTDSALARLHGVSRTAIGAIRKNLHYKNVI